MLFGLKHVGQQASSAARVTTQKMVMSLYCTGQEAHPISVSCEAVASRRSQRRRQNGCLASRALRPWSSLSG